ncbi:MAG: hypothetical protein COA79_07380 [Planctomycetota bacterium]|nr:MAG: hypothetical protein COA79_07380 [Planctomycetota bacterium]
MISKIIQLIAFSLVLLLINGCQKSSLSKNWAKDIAVYKWTEMLGDEPLEHYGYLAFKIKDGKVYSRAWMEYDRNGREWPAVEGLGYQTTANACTIIYRNGTYQIKHEFYHCTANFTFINKSKEMFVEYQQVTTDMSDELEGGNAEGLLVSKNNYTKKTQKEIDIFRRSLKYLKKAIEKKPCPVLPFRESLKKWHFKFNEKNYYFCCDSCLQAFKHNPKQYIK